MKFPKSEAILPTLLATYIISTGFTDLFVLPVFNKSVQLPELIFIITLFTWIATFYRQLPQLLKPTGLDIPLLALTGVFILSTIVNRDQKNFIDTAGLIYLFLVYTIFKTSLQLIPNPAKWITKSFVMCGLIAASLGIIGWLLFQFGIQTTLVKVEPHYPYFGEIARVTAFTTTPNMLFNLISICFLIYLAYFLSISQRHVKHYLIGSILLTALVLTFSKSILLLLICILMMLYQYLSKNKMRKMVLMATCIMLFIIFMTATHFFFIHSSNNKTTNTIYQGYFENKPITSIGEYQIFPTNYTVLKEASIIAGTENIMGVGPGGNNQFVQQLKNEERYPEYFENFDPHSLYTGTFGETGIFGLLALLWIMYEVLRKLNTLTVANNYVACGLYVCFIFFALEGMVLDILHFRHLWILLGVLSFMNVTTVKTKAT